MRLKLGLCLTLCLVVALTLVWAAGGRIPVYAGAGPAAPDPRLEVVLQVPAGSGAGTVGVLPKAEGDVPEGPQALAVDEAGSIYVADSVGRQILVFDGAAVRTINLPFAHYVRDLAVAGGSRPLPWSYLRREGTGNPVFSVRLTDFRRRRRRRSLGFS